MRRKGDYLISETDAYELPVFVGNIDEVSQFLEMPINTIRKLVNKGTTQGMKYQITRIEN